MKQALVNKISSKSVIIIAIILIIILLYVIYFMPKLIEQNDYTLMLPYFNALFNFLCLNSLFIGFINIKKKNINAHVKWMKLAFLFSSLFLISYLTHHSINGDQKFLTIGLLRPIYFFILISHILLSIVSFPLILLTFLNAAKENWVVHKRLARITFPIWSYVSVTGILIVIFLKFLNQ